MRVDFSIPDMNILLTTSISNQEEPLLVTSNKYSHSGYLSNFLK